MPRRKVIPSMDSVKDDEPSDTEEGQEITNIEILKGETDSVTEGNPITSTATDNSSAADSAEDDTSEGNKRNLSLEALFQAAHSELENISKETVTGGAQQAVKKQILSRVSSDNEKIKVSNVVAYLEVPQEMEKGTYVVQSTDGNDPTVMGQVIKVEEQGCDLTSTQESGMNTQVLHLVQSTDNSLHVKTSNIREHPLKLTPAIVIGAMPEDYSNKGSFTPDLTKLFVVNNAVSAPEGLKGITTAIGGGGRKRKHPQKPGKHICPYCNRGCAKPSVLKKHIRAHTGERPYPCSTCGLAFKTKSNLYKHCKSRWHLMKVGLSKEQASGSSRDETLASDSNCEEKDEDKRDGELKFEASQTPVNIENVPDLVADNAMKRTASPNLGEETEPKKRKSFSLEDETETAVKNVKLQSGGLVIDRQTSRDADQPVAIVHHVLTPTTQTKHEISMQNLFCSASQVNKTTNTTSHAHVSHGERLVSVSSMQNHQGIAVCESGSASSGSWTSLLSTQASMPQTAISHMNLPIIVTPSVVQSTRKPIEKSFSTNDLPDETSALPKQKNSFSHSISLHTDSSPVDGTDKKLKNPKMLLERISNLISANQAIMSTSVAIPPRKRVLRQQSSSLSVQSQSPMPGTQSSVIFQRSASLSDKLLMMKNSNPGVTMVQHGDMLRSLSVPTAVLTSSPGVHPEPLFVVKQVETKQDRITPKPVMQLPPGLLPSALGAGTAPKEIKIEFKLPKSNGPYLAKPSPDIIESNGISTTVHSPTSGSMEVTDTNVSRNVSQITRDRPQLAAILQGHTPTSTLSIFPQESTSREPTYVCGSCWQTFQDVKLLKIHQDNGCSGATGNLTVAIPQVQSSEESKASDKTLKTKPPKLLLPSLNEIPIQPKGTPITMVTPPTPTELPLERKKRGILQRQKNVIVEMVDPRQPPKRGRPKGARSVDSSFFGSTPNADEERPSLQRSHSTAESSASREEIPGELRGETPQALWKLKLKGRLLMKRSMSVERMLSQERELEQNMEKQNKSTLSPPSVKHLPLLRSRSYDETVTAQKRPVKDSDLKEKILSKLSKSCHNLTRDETNHITDKEEKNIDTNTLEPKATSSEESKSSSPVLVCSEEPFTSCREHLSFPISVPVNRAGDLFRAAHMMVSPLSLLRKLGTVCKPWLPSTISIPVNIAHKVPGLLQEAKQKSPDSSLSDVKKSEHGDPEHMECELSPADPGDDNKQLSIETNNRQKKYSNRSLESCDTKTGTEMRVEDSESAEELQTLNSKKKNVCTLHTIQMAGPSKQVQDRIRITLLLLGHSYPSMKAVSRSTFCCIHKTQPMYVILGGQNKVSMYSNWQAAPYDPNPKGLTSKQLLDLYQSERYDCEPRFVVAGASNKPVKCDVTQSSYWNSKEKESTCTDDNKEDSDSTVSKDIKIEMFPDLRDVHVHDPVPEEKQQVTKITMESVPEQPKELHIFPTAKDKLKEALSAEKVTKIRICDGGYKSTEDYVYVRGRGRGMYVCEKCGIRCKKPSMLKKHIRTHTDVRPYHCRFCNFSFKTKGNLTKHMKSKAHQKLCMDKGIVPVPTTVDEDCMINIMGDSMEESDSRVIYEDIDGPTVGHTEEVTDHQFSDAEDADRDIDEEDEDDIISEKSSGKEDGDEVQLLEVEVVTNPVNETQLEIDLKTACVKNEKLSINSGNPVEKGGSQSFSLDKEIAAASLLDLSKVTNSDCKDSDEQKAKSEEHMDTESDDQDHSENKQKDSETNSKNAVVGEKNLLQDSVVTKDITLFSTFGYIRGQNTYAHKIAMLKAANKCQSLNLVPPIGFDPSESSIIPVQSREKWANDKKEPDDLGPIVGQFIRPDVTISVDKQQNKESSSVQSASGIQKTILQLAKISVGSVPSLETNVRFVEGEGHAPCEIIPIPIHMSDELEEVDDNGRFVCQVCSKVFDKKHQLTLHRNIHMLEKPYKCEDCSLSFQSRMLLDKHQSSDRHQQQVALMQQMGATTSEDPRPFKCEECGIAFRIQGHLARHLRSKMHISKLEALGKVPIGSYDQVDFDPAAAMMTTTSVTTPITTSCTMSRTSMSSTNVIQLLETSNDMPQKVKFIKRASVITPESDLSVAKRPRIDQSCSESAKDEITSINMDTEMLQSPPAHDSTFSYQTLDEYEKVDLASNDRVTVEIKSEPIEFGEILPKTSQKQDERETDAENENEDVSIDGPHKCGICGKTFKEISFLKHHLVSHAELRPYVCEYCDAGFTTALSLKYHLPMHAQERPYLCGYCGSTFARSELLHKHLNDFHGSQAFEPASQSTVGSSVIKSTQSTPVSLNTTTTTGHRLVNQTVNINPKSQYIVQVAGHTVISSESNPVIQTTSQMVTEETPSSSGTSGTPEVSSCTVASKSRMLSRAGSNTGLVRQMAIDTDSLPLQKADESHGGNVITLDLNNYEVQECIEETDTGEEHTVYMLVVPDGKMENLDLIGSQSESVTTSLNRQLKETFTNHGRHDSGSDIKHDSLTVHQRETSAKVLSPASCGSQSLLDAEVASARTDAGIKWKVIHMTDMSLSPIFDNEENPEGHNPDNTSKSS